MTRLLFAFEGPRRVALVRIALGLVLLCHAGCRWRYAVELYSTFGPAMPIFTVYASDAPLEIGESNDRKDARPGPLVSRFHGPIPSPLEAVALHSLLLFALVAITLGWQTRTSLLVACGLLVWLGLIDGAATFAKHLLICVHLLVLLTCSGCGRCWSLDSLTDPARDDLCRLDPVWPRRMMQWLVCAIYFGAAVTKLRTPAFLTGDLLGFSLLDDYWGGGPVGIWLSSMPHVVLGLSLATVLFELLFPFLIWVPRLRLIMLAAAVAFHLGMAAAMHLSTFSPTMFVALIPFLHESDLMRLRLPGIGSSAFAAAGLAPGHRRRLYAAAAYVVCAVAVVVSGCFVQRQYDWYGAFGRRSLNDIASLPSIPDDQWADMQAQRQPPWEDFVHRTSLGTRASGTQVFGAPDRFRGGDTVYVLVQFIPGHPELLLEGLLIAPDGQEAARFSHRVPRNVAYSVNGFELTEELPPGRYRVIFQVQGFEFAERGFDLTP